MAMLFPTFVVVAVSLAFACAAIVLFFRASVVLTIVKDNAEAIKIILAAIAALYTAWIYYIEMRDNRAANALQFQEKVAAPHLQEAFASLDVFWIRGPGTRPLCKFRIDVCKPLSEEQYTDIDDHFAQKTRDLIRTHKLEKEILTIHDFYRDIVVCVDQGRCHKETACELFGSDIENFRLIYREFLDEWDALWQTGVSMDLGAFFDDCNTDFDQSNVDEFACEWLRTGSGVESALQVSPDVVPMSRCTSLELPSASSYIGRRKERVH